MSTVIDRPSRDRGRDTTLRPVPSPAPRARGRAGSGATRIRKPARPVPTRSRRPNPSLWRAGRPKVRVAVLFSVCTALLLGTVARVAMLQTVDRDTYANFGEQQRLDKIVITAERGMILDRNLQALAISVPQTTIWADPRLVTDPAGAANALGQALGYNVTEIERLRAALSAEGSQFTYVKRQVDDQTADLVRSLVKDQKIDGIYFQSEPKRFTPSGDVARSIVGATDPDGKGTAGLEFVYDSLLTGTPGELVRERDRAGRTIPQGHHEVVAAKSGTGIVTTIDQTLQYRVEQLLLTHAKNLGAVGGGMVTVMDSKTGDLLALASVAMNKDTGELVVTSKNRPLLDAFEAGSVMKIVPSSAALDTGASTVDQVWDLPASIASADDTIHNAEVRMGGQSLTFKDIITESSNIGTVKLAQAIGIDTFEKYLHAFGFGEKSAVDFPNETAGLLPPSSKWYGSQRDTIAYGQGVSVTQVQMTAAMNTIANGGVYVAPRLVSATVAADGTTTPLAAPSTHQVLQPAAAAGMTEVLESVVCSPKGTVGSHREKYLNLPGYRVAGKTGTGYKAQNKGYLIGYDPKTGKKKIDNYKDENGQYHYVASFSGFVPAESPALTISVTIDEPPFGPNRFGASAAAPLFAQVASEALRMLAVPPSTGGECPGAAS